MPLFSYSGKDAKGEHVSGTIDSLSLQAARDALKEMAIAPEELHEATLSEIQTTATPPIAGSAAPAAPTASPPSAWPPRTAEPVAVPPVPASPAPPSVTSTPPPATPQAAVSPVVPAAPAVPLPSVAPPVTPTPPPSAQPPLTQEPPKPAPQSNAQYFPLLDTFRLYAGWLLAWYFLVYAFGSYMFSRAVRFEVPFLSGLFQSPLVLSFTFGSFLFLLFSTVSRKFWPGKLHGTILTLVGVILFFVFRMNVA